MGDDRGAIIAVTGGRDFTDIAHVFTVLDWMHEGAPIGLLVHGACGMKLDKRGFPVGEMKGADALAHQWAVRRGVTARIFPADWDRFGGPAGPRRNGIMLRSETFDWLVAFPGGAGTQSAIDIARTLDIPLRVERGGPMP